MECVHGSDLQLPFSCKTLNPLPLQAMDRSRYTNKALKHMSGPIERLKGVLPKDLLNKVVSNAR